MRFREFWDEEEVKAQLTATRKRMQERGSIVSRKRISAPKQMTVYHGFQKDPASFNYLFDPKKSEQNLLWFTHDYMRGDPVEYAKGQGNNLLTYSVKSIHHKDELTYENGSKEYESPEDINVNANENSKYLHYFDTVIELPEGWFFTYKVQKFIGCSVPIKANASMVSGG